MAKLKKGTNVGLDKNLHNIRVSDVVKDEAGVLYTIDAYGKAVRNADKKAFNLSELKEPEVWIRLPGMIRIKDTPDTPPEPEKQLDPGLLPGFNPGDTSVREAPDKMLVEELRLRGWDVTATKVISL